MGHPHAQEIPLPHFGLLGQALLTVQFSYDVQATVQAIGTNTTSGPVQVGGGFSGVDLSANILDPAGSLLFVASNFGPNEPCVGGVGNTTVQPGQQLTPIRK
jgi:hypothetical protein